MMNEIRRQAFCTMEEGYDKAPGFMIGIEAEIVVEDNSEIIFLHAQWCNEPSSSILYEASEKSMYCIYESINKGMGDFEELIGERDGIRIIERAIVAIENDDFERNSVKYPLQYKELREMVLQKIEENGLYDYIGDFFLDEE